MAVQANHLPNIVIAITLSAAPQQGRGFGVVLGIWPLATNSLNGLRTQRYASVTEAAAAVTSGYLSAAAYNSIVAQFAQNPSPSEVMIGNIDLVGLETYATAYAACKASDDGFYGVWISSRVTADIDAISDAVEADTAGRKLFVGQSAASDWLSGTVPAGLTGWATKERAAVVYHDVATEYADAAILTNRLAFSPDNQSVPWSGMSIAGVNPYTAPITQAQRLSALGVYCMILGPYGAETMVADPGKNAKGRPIKEIETSDWFYARLQEAIADIVVSRANAGEAIVVDASGQALILAELEALIILGKQIGHFTGPHRAAAVAITASDLSNQRLRFTAQVQVATAARLFDFAINLSRDPVAVP